MKRSKINEAVRSATKCFEAHGWALPPEPRWDVTDFGLGKFDEYGLTIINLAEEKEYCEKLMYARRNQKTPAHCHGDKKEDIICRWGTLMIQVWNKRPGPAADGEAFRMQVNGKPRDVKSGEILRLGAGERITLVPGGYHEFWPESEECIIGEVSTYNDDVTDNVFVNPDIGRYATIDEDEPPMVRLLNETE